MTQAESQITAIVLATPILTARFGPWPTGREGVIVCLRHFHEMSDHSGLPEYRAAELALDRQGLLAWKDVWHSRRVEMLREFVETVRAESAFGT